MIVCVHLSTSPQVLIGTGVGQIRYLNRALMRFDSKVSRQVSLPRIQRDASQVVIPAQFVLFNLSAILGSAILYGDFKTAKFHQFVTFMYGCTATFAGVWIIAWVPTSKGPSTGPDDPSGAINDFETEGHRLLVPDDVPAGGRKPGNIPVLKSRRSTVSLVGISPAQVQSGTLYISKNQHVNLCFSA
jgi:hypothetical protein